MAACDEARQLLIAANKDLRALQGMTDPNYFADEIFGFHAQQTVEKSLKAWLSLLGIQYPKTHDISLLLSMLSAHDGSAELYYDLIEFNPYAVQFRYEAFDEIGQPLDRPTVYTRINELVRKVGIMIDS